jgi:dinuclear metal center YbgI/SA1388 family protein
MKKHVDLRALVAALDKTLGTGQFQDSSHNGLQVGRRDGRVTKICLGVDASLPLYEEALRRGAQLVICHHGLSWGDSMARATGYNFDHLEFLIQNKIALYATHLPLDAHSRLGNNAQIAKALKLENVAPFLRYHGGPEIGFKGAFAKPVSLDAFAALVKRITGRDNVTVFPFGKKSVRTVGIVSGSAAYEVHQAIDEKLDAYLSGEPALDAYNRAAHGNINAVFAGHYATETFGVKALAKHLVKIFGIEAEFVDFKIPW